MSFDGFIVKAEFLVERREFIQRRVTLGVHFSLVRQHILQHHPVMGADRSKRNHPGIKKLREVGPGNIEQLSCLICG